MYPSSSSSSSQGSMGPSGSRLVRYGSAPGSLLANAVDSVIGSTREFSSLRSQTQTQTRMGPSCYFSSETSSLTSESTCKANNNNSTGTTEHKGTGLQRSFGLNESAVGEFGTAGDLKSDGGGGSTSSASLVRHSSSPAGFLNYLATASSADNGFSNARGIGRSNYKGGSDSSHGISRLSSQLSFTGQDSLSQISEESEDVIDGMGNDGHRNAAHSYAHASFGMSSWDNASAITFSDPPSKRAKNIGGILVNGGNNMESQFQFSTLQTALEMASVERLLQIPQDSVPCKIRAKRGCATHPRSIAERERRTRISGKLKNLQDLVPNMDKQTSYADMLDLAVQHIKGLQNQVQNLKKDLEGCTCGCK
ncbi:unnamed protein product [Ilex paraguariensis]|uniref:BHLH domain-containing protein n=1 Tax=Ilex paraguariensis TaxID=185542 RepID=A0ABC8TMF6_9AQUA